jgi:hypothetical protein
LLLSAWNPSIFRYEKSISVVYSKESIFCLDDKKRFLSPQFGLHKKGGVRTWIHIIRHFAPTENGVLDYYEDENYQIRFNRCEAVKPSKHLERYYSCIEVWNVIFFSLLFSVLFM